MVLALLELLPVMVGLPTAALPPETLEMFFLVRPWYGLAEPALTCYVPPLWRSEPA